MKNSKLTSLFLLTSFLATTGCATMYGDNTRRIQVDSNPKGADIYVDGERMGSTPSVITLPSYVYGGKKIILKKKDYKESLVNVNTQFQPVSIWNILNVFGFLVDAATGDIIKIDPSDLSVKADLDKND